MMKIYKIYAQCVRGIKKTIQEIDKKEAEDLIIETVNIMVDMEDIYIDGETDDEINAAYEKLYDKAIKYFEEESFFQCGDYALVRDEEEPSRWGSYGWTREFI